MDSMNAIAAAAAPSPDHAYRAEKVRKGTGDGARVHVVRRDPEKRRQQNLQAQKKYREKLRKRLDDLEALAASVASSRHRGREAAAAAAPAAILSEGPTGAILSQDNFPTGGFLQHSGPPVPGDVFTLESASASDSSFPCLSELTQSNLKLPEGDSDSSLDRLTWDPTTSIDPSHLIPDKYDDSPPSFWAFGYVDCGCPTRHIHVRIRDPSPYNKGVPVFSIGPSLFPADPYMNNLRIERVCFIEALYSNFLHLGMTEDIFCAEDAVSPFFRPTKMALDDPSNNYMVLTIQSIFQTLKPDLRPNREQIIIGHHPFIDVLPFPMLRRNFLRSQHGMVTSKDEIFRDMLEGLICWGSCGVSGSDRNCSTGMASTGTPWDCRSWEAKPWFVRKYWTLLGGREGELVRQTKWWRHMRGDEVDPSL